MQALDVHRTKYSKEIDDPSAAFDSPCWMAETICVAGKPVVWPWQREDASGKHEGKMR
jgi:hypothetical protein